VASGKAMVTVFAIEQGIRYETTPVGDLHLTLASARAVIEALPDIGAEQFPPADGTVASWINDRFECVCIREKALS
jgi:hypothetical protein